MTDVQKFWEENKMDFPVKVYHDRIETKHNKIYTKMIKTVTHIDCPKEWESLNDWDSHRELLWLATEKIKGGFIEFGSGDGSTKLLKDKLGDLFISFDNNKEWCEKTGSKYTQSYMQVNIVGCKDNLQCLFVDCAPAELRKPLIQKWMNEVPVIIVHDSEITSSYIYDLANTLPLFKYRLDYQPEGKPHTCCVSNKINVCDWV